jgi:hypothetical protein
MSKDITLPDATLAGRVRLLDPNTDLELVYTVATLTRSRKRELRRIAATLDEVDDDVVLTDDEEDRQVRTLCDMLNVLLVAGDDRPGAGDLLYDRWAAEEITDDQIGGLVQRLQQSQADPT